jgi:5-methylcytosine-specific restriction enzyme subunit McrC
MSETISLLDEVEDQICSVQQLNSIRITALFKNYEEVIHSCRMILENQLYSHAEYEMKNWSLLFPMEYIFEDFVAGFLQTHFGAKWNVEYQKSNAYLTTNPDAFQMQHDIFLTSRDVLKRKIIVDTKYKIRDYSATDKKKGISQSDLYQVVSYAYRRGVNEVLLIYPNVSEVIKPIDTFEVPSGFDGKTINVKVTEIPFWSTSRFANIEASLKTCLHEVLN